MNEKKLAAALAWAQAKDEFEEAKGNLEKARKEFDRLFSPGDPDADKLTDGGVYFREYWEATVHTEEMTEEQLEKAVVKTYPLDFVKKCAEVYGWDTDKFITTERKFRLFRGKS